MGSKTINSFEFIEKIASKLAVAFESPIAIASCAPSPSCMTWEILETGGREESLLQSLRSELQQLDLHALVWNDGLCRIVNQPNPPILAIDVSEQRDGSLALFAFHPEAPKALIDTLVSAMRTQMEYERLNSSPLITVLESEEDHAESYIEQITQDFEELTWFRDSHRFADLYSVKASAVDLAYACVSPMAQVIRAESLLFLELQGQQNPQPTETARVHSLAGPQFPAAAWQLELWIQQLSERGYSSPILLDQSCDEAELKRFPNIRNCMLTVVAKGERTYGWLIAINKVLPEEDRLHRIARIDEWNALRFGTFEGGLLTTAANMLASQASNSESFAAQEELTKGLVLAIINAIDAKDCYTAGHSERVASFAECIMSRMGLPKKDCEQIHMAGLLHDVGKIGIPDSILKKPGKLTDQEFDVIKSHPLIGYSILKHLTNIAYVLPGVLLHHEAVNGSGYPQGRKGDDIPLMARILAVCDAFDAMTSTRPYRTALPLEKAIEILKKESGTSWDSAIVRTLLDCIEDGTIHPGKVASTRKLSPNLLPSSQYGDSTMAFSSATSVCLGGNI
jgi:HD-GYP domain-containing protein (c-di-GMP phosphodiesterase class II)